MKKLKAFDLQPMKKYFKFNPKTGRISEWKSEGLTDGIIKPPDTTLAPTPEFNMYLIFNGDCLKQDEEHTILTMLGIL